MKPLIPLSLVLSLSMLPLAAQESPAPDTGAEDGFDLIDEGARLILRGLLEEADPAITELRGLAEGLEPTLRLLGEEVGPALAEVIGQIDSITYYELPEILPSGDIILRRRADAPPWEPPPQSEVDL